MCPSPHHHMRIGKFGHGAIDPNFFSWVYYDGGLSYHPSRGAFAAPHLASWRCCDDFPCVVERRHDDGRDDDATGAFALAHRYVLECGQLGSSVYCHYVWHPSPVLQQMCSFGERCSLVRELYLAQGLQLAEVRQ